MKDAFELSGTDVLAAIDLANTVRKVAEVDPVDDLLPGIANDAGNCVLANTFNCQCLVGCPTIDGPWYVGFIDKKYAEALASELDEDIEEYVGYDFKVSNNETFYSVRLPFLVGEIASRFDLYDLPDEYYKA